MLFKKIRLLDDELLEQVAVLLTNAGREHKMLSVATIAVALEQSTRTVSRCLHSLRELGLATADRDRAGGWGATSDLMESWRYSRNPRLFSQRVAEGFDACIVCGSPNKAIVRFCTFCGLEVRNSTDSIDAGRKLRQEEAAVRSHVAATPNYDDADDGVASELTKKPAIYLVPK
jgi:hypothetical protein